MISLKIDIQHHIACIGIKKFIAGFFFVIFLRMFVGDLSFSNMTK